MDKYSDLARECCVDGLKALDVLELSCEYRASFIVDGEECTEAFLHCCNRVSSHREESAEEEIILARSERIINSSIQIKQYISYI